MSCAFGSDIEAMAVEVEFSCHLVVHRDVDVAQSSEPSSSSRYHRSMRPLPTAVFTQRAHVGDIGVAQVVRPPIRNIGVLASNHEIPAEVMPIERQLIVARLFEGLAQLSSSRPERAPLPGPGTPAGDETHHFKHLLNIAGSGKP